MDIASVVNLGVGGFSILVMWWMYDSSQKERNKHFDAFRLLEKEVREKIMLQLNENTRAFERILEHFR